MPDPTSAARPSASTPDPLRLGLVGCGSRGVGAVLDCLAANDGVTVAALADAFEAPVHEARATLRDQHPDAVDVPDDRCFAGLDAYRRLLETDVDLVYLVSLPAFYPAQLEAAVDAGKHVFIEKPLAVDPSGVRRVLRAAERSEAQGLALMVGTQRRHDPAYRAAVERIHDGALGEVVAAQVYWMQENNPTTPRDPSWSMLAWQLRNWYFFPWLCGDIIVEQHLHNLDVANWVLGAHPVRAVGVGGRQAHRGEDFGYAYDHFAVEFEYPGGARVQSFCRQTDGAAGRIGERFVGTRGTSDACSWIRGADAWTYDGPEVNAYRQEHADLVAGIRGGAPPQEGRRGAESTLTAILGREAAYTGRELTWDEVLHADQRLVPDDLALEGDAPFPEPPAPGATPLERGPW